MLYENKQYDFYIIVLLVQNKDKNFSKDLKAALLKEI